MAEPHDDASALGVGAVAAALHERTSGRQGILKHLGLSVYLSPARTRHTMRDFAQRP
jgi:hypothetical protein